MDDMLKIAYAWGRAQAFEDAGFEFEKGAGILDALNQVVWRPGLRRSVSSGGILSRLAKRREIRKALKSKAHLTRGTGSLRMEVKDLPWLPPGGVPLGGRHGKTRSTIIDEMVEGAKTYGKTAPQTTSPAAWGPL